ncbi:MAG: glycosyltransferase family 39 protein [Anaerolineae bacterium]|nr:glycosyltransferase family 39 protein [Anaerolineae bacterium]
MSYSRPLDRRLRVPEPWEIVAWLRRARAALRRHFTQPTNQLFWGLLLVAALLRLAYLDLIPLASSQLQHLLQALQIVQGGPLPGAGPSTPAGIARPPALGYLLSLPLLFGRDPRLAVVVTIAVHLGALAAIFLIARRHLGLRVAFVATALLACNPWAVLAARSISEGAVLLPAAICVLVGLNLALSDRRPWGWVLACIAAGLMVNTSLTALPVIAVILILALLYRRRTGWLHLALGLALIALISVPYASQQNLSRFADVRAALRAVGADLAHPNATLQAFRAAAWLHSGGGIESLTAPSTQDFESSRLLGRIGQLGAVTFFIALPTILWLALSRWSKWRSGQDTAPYLIPCVWLLIVLIGMPALPEDLAASPFIGVLPVGLLSMALVLDRLYALPDSAALRARWWSQFLKLGLVLLFFIFLVWQIFSLLHLLSFVSHHDVSAGYSMPFRYWRRTANLVRREAREGDIPELWMLADGSSPTTELAPQILAYLLEDELETVLLGHDGSQGLLLPAGRPGVYLVSDPSSLAAGVVRQLGAQRRGVVLFPDGTTTLSVHVVEAREVESLLELIPQRGLWGLDSGLRLVGYDWPPSARPGEAADLATYWTFLDVPSEDQEGTHRVFTRLIDVQGRPVAQCEAFALPEAHWMPGLLLKQWCTLQLPANMPPGEYALLVGSVRLDEGVRNRYVDAHGRALGEAIPLGPVVVNP